MPSKTNLQEIAKLVRHSILTSTTAAESGHPTSSLSAVELMVGLLFSGIFRADLTNPHDPHNDRLIFSKGHAAPLLYSLYAAAGKVGAQEMRTLRKLGSRLQGHPMPDFPYAEAPTGSLGQGLSIGLGMALAAQMDGLRYRTFVLLGDGEMAEGSVWEAIGLAGHNRVPGLIAIVDVNRLGQSGQTMVGWHPEIFAKRIRSFGWKKFVVDGHDFSEILKIYHAALAVKNRPVAILAKTVKGKGVSFLEDKPGWHGKALSKQQLALALKELGRVRKVRGEVALSSKGGRNPSTKGLHHFPHGHQARPPLPFYDPAQPVAVRKALGNALVRLAPAFPHLVVLDGEVKNSTYTELFQAQHPRLFVESFIAEQNMAGIANGLAARGRLPVAATFAAFFTRAFDQLRMAAYAGTHQVFIGTHAGVHIGQDGPSQMGLEDIALFRALANSIVLYPSDAYAAERLLECALQGHDLVYLRATRGETPILYSPSTTFHIGGSHTLRRSPKDRATIVGAGITLHEALKAADILQRQRVRVRVLDCYSIKPVDAAALRKAARETDHLIVVEDHRPEGGLADAVRSALGPWAGRVTSLAVRTTPRSGTPEQLFKQQKIDAASIVRAVEKNVAK